MGNVVQMTESVPEALRAIADYIDEGTRNGETCTLVLDGHLVITIGRGRLHPDQQAKEALFDLTVGAHRLMYPVCKEFG